MTAPRAPTPLQPLLAALGREPSRTWSVLVTLFGDAIVPRGGEVWLGTLLDIFAALDVAPGVVRTAASRLARDGWIERRRAGRLSFYRLAGGGRAPFAAAGRSIYAARPPAWDGALHLIIVPEGEAGRAALAQAGFGQPLAGLWLGAALPPAGAGGIALTARADPAALRRLAAMAWPLARLAESYARFAGLFAPLGAHAAGLGGLEALAARTLLIHHWRRIVLRDPRLPAALLPEGWPGEAARALCARLYHALLPASEAWLDAHGRGAAGPLPPPGPELAARFR
jgi:phenylacetic acid degradation operon negative regulatory protein